MIVARPILSGTYFGYSGRYPVRILKVPWTQVLVQDQIVRQGSYQEITSIPNGYSRLFLVKLEPAWPFSSETVLSEWQTRMNAWKDG